MTTRTWFITGVNSGFGRELAEQLLARGDRVAGTVRREGSVDDLRAGYGERFWLGHLDVTDLAQVRKVVDAAFDELGRIDVVVINAGYGLFGAAEEFTDEQVVHQITTNLLGSIQTARAALPHLRAQAGGRIIQLSSVSRPRRPPRRLALPRGKVGRRRVHGGPRRRGRPVRHRGDDRRARRCAHLVHAAAACS